MAQWQSSQFQGVQLWAIATLKSMTLDPSCSKAHRRGLKAWKSPLRSPPSVQSQSLWCRWGVCSSFPPLNRSWDLLLVLIDASGSIGSQSYLCGDLLPLNRFWQPPSSHPDPWYDSNGPDEMGGCKKSS